MAEYRGVQYQTVQTANPTGFKWIVHLDATRTRTSCSPSSTSTFARQATSFPPKLTMNGTTAYVRCSGDTVAKVLSGQRTKIIKTADALHTRRGEGPHRFAQKTPRTCVSG